jgi:hypothetical protein
MHIFSLPVEELYGYLVTQVRKAFLHIAHSLEKILIPF